MSYKTQEFPLPKMSERKIATAYYTDRPGRYMVNAATGVIIDGIFGSKDEDLYYTVQIATGKTVPYHTPIKLVFEDPCEYEEFFETCLTERTHDAWCNKMERLRKEGRLHS